MIDASSFTGHALDDRGEMGVVKVTLLRQTRWVPAHKALDGTITAYGIRAQSHASPHQYTAEIRRSARNGTERILHAGRTMRSPIIFFAY